MHLYIIYVFRCLVIIIRQRDANLMTPQTTDMGKMVQKASIKIVRKMNYEFAKKLIFMDMG